MSEVRAGLYLHIPFCSRVCPYCDFAVRTGNHERRRRFVDDLLGEIALYADYPLEFDTIYFGGGTPSTLPPGDLERIVDAVREQLRFPEEPWISLEVNPEDVSPESVVRWRRIGVEFLSLGVQSIDAQALRFLGRQHDPDGARRAVATALEGGFHTVSLDLIYGLPEQTPDRWRAELDGATRLGVQHLSCYQLTIHNGTRFGLLEKRGELAQLKSDAQGELFRLTHRRLADAGYHGYEASNFAIDPKHRSRHNLKYWNHSPYLGLGPSAHSLHDRSRWWNLRTTDPWQQSVRTGRRPIDAIETLDDRSVALEMLMLGLRTYEGVELDPVSALVGGDVAQANRVLIGRLETQGLLRFDAGRLLPTIEGLAVADGLAVEFELSV